MSKEDKYLFALDTIYNTLKERKFEFQLADRYIIESIIKYIEKVKEFAKD